MRLGLLALGAVLVLAGCGGGSEDGGDTATTTTTAQSPTTTAAAQSPTRQANSYALEQSGGVTEGCLTGPESADNPGCVYSAAFAGCLAGRTGSAPDWSVSSRVPPGDLKPVYERGVKDCGG